eukprot:scaffold17244_cov55-Attheya_sp.AAC.1
MASRDEVPQECVVWVDVIVPVHNASGTIVETIESAMHQIIPPDVAIGPRLDVCVCCYDDGSTDNSWSLLKQLTQTYHHSDSSHLPDKREEASSVGGVKIPTRLLIHKSESGISRGAGYARNQAASLRQRFGLDDATTATNNKPNQYYCLCLLDSDDVMHKTRIAHQVGTMLALPSDDARHLTLLGCQFDRDPPDSTWHYAHWANHLLTPDRLSLEQFREITLLQPTWMLSRSRFDQLGGYIEAPAPKPTTLDAAATAATANESALEEEEEDMKHKDSSSGNDGRIYKLIHPVHDTAQTLRLAEDLRFFYAHLHAHGRLQRVASSVGPLVTYRHRAGMSQSSSTSRKLLLQLRVKAFEDNILLQQQQQQPHEHNHNRWKHGFVVWGAGRDGKDFVKSMRPQLRDRVVCFVDVDDKKIAAGHYWNPNWGKKIPIVHFSWLASNPIQQEELHNSWMNESQSNTSDCVHGRINKKRPCPTNNGGDNDNANDTSRVKDTTICKVPEVSSTPPTENSRGSPSPLLLLSKQKTTAIVRTKSLGRDFLNSLGSMPVVVCVAMYRTNGVLESNVKSIGRTEGLDLWHFS